MKGRTESTQKSEDRHLHYDYSIPNGRPSENGDCPASILGAASFHQDVQPQVMPIAVVGMSCRLPGGSTSPAKLWDMLANGRSGWSQIPGDRFTQSSFQHPSSNVEGTVRDRPQSLRGYVELMKSVSVQLPGSSFPRRGHLFVRCTLF